MEILRIEPFLPYFDNIHARTMRVARCTPPDKLDWTYAPGKWTLGDLLRHIAAVKRYVFAENVQGKPSAYHGCGPELADGYDAVIAFMERMHAESMDIFRRLTPELLAAKTATAEGTPITTWKWLRAAVEHECHHRGQVYMYLGMLGVKTPPIFGLTSEEMRARSVAPPERRGV
jgi:uncharacterized damage-inducible protein DinB